MPNSLVWCNQFFQHDNWAFKGTDLIDLSYVPIFNSKAQSTMAMKIIPASHVTADSGTGLVHCAPAHGAEDYMAFRSLGLISNLENMICHVNADGNFTKDVASVVGQKAAMLLLGQQVLGEGGRAIVEMLKKMERLVKVKRTKHRYPYDWRTDKPIIVTWIINDDLVN